LHLLQTSTGGCRYAPQALYAQVAGVARDMKFRDSTLAGMALLYAISQTCSIFGEFQYHRQVATAQCRHTLGDVRFDVCVLEESFKSVYSPQTQTKSRTPCAPVTVPLYLAGRGPRFSVCSACLPLIHNEAAPQEPKQVRT
jgi:hypothetical protein